MWMQSSKNHNIIKAKQINILTNMVYEQYTFNLSIV